MTSIRNRAVSQQALCYTMHRVADSWLGSFLDPSYPTGAVVIFIGIIPICFEDRPTMGAGDIITKGEFLGLKILVTVRACHG